VSTGTVADRSAAFTAAAKWWGDRFREGAPGRMGDGFGDVLNIVSRSAKQRPTEEVIRVFEAALAERLMGMGLTHGVCFGTDYHPDGILGGAMEVAGLDAEVAPLKTLMWVFPDLVEAAYGYGSPFVQVYPPVEERPSKEA
jgi:hypothetical protein